MSEQANGMSDAKSALHASLDSKKDQSYYYAHQPRNTTEAPAPLPVHEALRKEQRVVEPAVESVERYQFLDGEKCAKVYIPLDNLSRIGDDAISSEFTSQSFTVDIRDYKPNSTLRLTIKALEGDINPDECKVKKLENKVVVYLAKVPNEEGKCFPWRNLKK